MSYFIDTHMRLPLPWMKMEEEAIVEWGENERQGLGRKDWGGEAVARM